MKYFIAAFVAFVALSLHNFASAAVTIDFEDFTARGIVPIGNSPGASVPITAQVADQYKTDFGVSFSSSAPYVAAVLSATGFGLGGVGGASASDQLSYADPVTISFFVPGTNTPGVTDNVSIQGDVTGLGSPYQATLTAFDINNVQIGAQTLIDSGGEMWAFTNLPGIHSVQFNFPGQPPFGQGTGIALDNLTFGDIDPAVSAVPEPASLIVWSVLGVAGIVAYQRRRKAA